MGQNKSMIISASNVEESWSSFIWILIHFPLPTVTKIMHNSLESELLLSVESLSMFIYEALSTSRTPIPYPRTGLSLILVFGFNSLP